MAIGANVRPWQALRKARAASNAPPLTMRFRSDCWSPRATRRGIMAEIGSLRRWLCAGLLCLLPLLAACSSGRHSMGFVAPQLMGAYIPLAQRETLFLNR